MTVAKYKGKFVAEFLNDGRLVRLVEPFGYVDPFGMNWDVPANIRVDGASIPRVLWSLGSPFTGKYRDASVIHDYFCDIRSRTWGAVHRVFYDAMITSGVHKAQAVVMYAAVCWGGPRWSQTVVNNYQEAFKDYLKSSHEGSGRLHHPMPAEPTEQEMAAYDRIMTKVTHYPLDSTHLGWLEQRLSREDVAVEDIASLVEHELARLNLEPLVEQKEP